MLLKRCFIYLLNIMLMESSSVAEHQWKCPWRSMVRIHPLFLKKFFSFFRKVYLNWLTGSPVAQLHRAVVESARLGVGVSPGHKKVGKFFYNSFGFY